MRHLAMLGLLLTACAEGLPLDELDAAHRRAECTWRVRCGYYGSMASCLDQVELNDARPPLRVTPSLAAAVDAHLITYDPIQAEECLALIEDTACNPGDLARRWPLALCTGVFRSGRPLGAPCAFDAECESRTCEAEDACPRETCCDRRCASVPGVGGPGSSCLEIPCGPTSFCLIDTCVPLLPAGEPCLSDRQCDFGLVCLDTCQPPLPVGAECQFTRLATWACGGDAPCDQTSLRCVAHAPIGAPCDPDHPHCQSDAVCDPATARCAPLPRIGEPCPQGECPRGSLCRPLPPAGSICAPLAPVGAQCGSDADCASGACASTWVCVEPPICT